MKISNAGRIKLLAYVMVVFITMALFVSLFTRSIYVNFALYASVVLFLLAFLRLKSTELDSSGSCFTVRRRHPFKEKGYIRPEVEFPISSVQEVFVRKAALSCRFNVKIHSQNSGKNFRINLLLFDQKKLEKLQAVIQNDKQFL